MTCVAVHVHDGVAHLAADSLAYADGSPTVSVSKLVELPHDIVIGVAGRAAAMNLLRRHLHPMRLHDDAADHEADDWAQELAEDATAMLLEYGIVEDDTDGREFEGAFILACRGRVWEITTNLALRVRRDFHAIGSGEAAAMGAMWAVDRTRQPVAVVGVAAAAEIHVDVGGTVQTTAT